MRLWSLHPVHLDRVGLVACWRESLLAQAVLAGRTKGYLRHPQLERFRAAADPLGTLGRYLMGLADEADRRGYRFNRTLIDSAGGQVEALTVTVGQLDLEWRHLGAKLAVRSPEALACWLDSAPSAHPLFTVVDGAVEPWERASLDGHQIEGPMS